MLLRSFHGAVEPEMRALLLALLCAAGLSSSWKEVSSDDCSASAFESSLADRIAAGELEPAQATQALLLAECAGSCCAKCQRAGWWRTKCKPLCCVTWAKSGAGKKKCTVVDNPSVYDVDNPGIALCQTAAPTAAPTPALPTPPPPPHRADASAVSATDGRAASSAEAKHKDALRAQAAVQHRTRGAGERWGARAAWLHDRLAKARHHGGYPALSTVVDGKEVWLAQAHDCGGIDGSRCTRACCNECVRGRGSVGSCKERCCRPWRNDLAAGKGCVALPLPHRADLHDKLLLALNVPLCRLGMKHAKQHTARPGAKLADGTKLAASEEGTGWDDDAMFMLDPSEPEGGKLDALNAAGFHKLLQGMFREDRAAKQQSSRMFSSLFGHRRSPRKWATWDGSGSCAGAPCGVRCAQDLHARCRHHDSAAACADCASTFGIVDGDKCPPAHALFVCRHLVLAQKAAKIRRARHSARNALYTQPAFRPRGGFASTFGEMGACLLDKAEVLLDLAFLLGTCTEYVRFRGAACYTRDALDWFQNVGWCCDGNERSTHETATLACHRATDGLLATARKALLPRWSKCSASYQHCNDMRGGALACTRVAKAASSPTPPKTHRAWSTLRKHALRAEAEERRILPKAATSERREKWKQGAWLSNLDHGGKAYPEGLRATTTTTTTAALDTIPSVPELLGAADRPPWLVHRPMPAYHIASEYSSFVQKEQQLQQQQQQPRQATQVEKPLSSLAAAPDDAHRNVEPLLPEVNNANGDMGDDDDTAWERKVRAKVHKDNGAFVDHRGGRRLLRAQRARRPWSLFPFAKTPTKPPPPRTKAPVPRTAAWWRKREPPRAGADVDTLVADLAVAGKKEPGGVPWWEEAEHTAGQRSGGGGGGGDEALSGASLLRAATEGGGTRQAAACIAMVSGGPQVPGALFPAPAGCDVPFASLFESLVEAARTMYFGVMPLHSGGHQTTASGAQDLTDAAKSVLALCDTHAENKKAKPSVISDDDDDALAQVAKSEVREAAAENHAMCAAKLASFVHGIGISQTGFDADLGDPREQN